MNTLFEINFRREAFRRERADARRRAFGLGVWLTYFGMLTVLLGLYGLNYFELGSRMRQLKRQVERLRASQQGADAWVATPGEAATVEPWVADAGGWRDLLGRLPRLLPQGARLTGLEFNPDEVSGAERRLLLTGVLRVNSRLDRMAGVTDFVGVVAKDSLFAAHFHSVRLVSTRVQEGGSDAEFRVECR